MTPHAFGRLTEIPPGPVGALATLRVMAEQIRTPDPGLIDFVGSLHANNLALPDTMLARALFDWTREHFLYQEDTEDTRGGVVVAESIQNPGTTWAQMQAAPDHRARGDCDDYIVWLGALYYWLGWPVALQAVSLSPDGQLDHVYLRVTVDGHAYGADPIPDAGGAFGWDPPGVVARVEWPV